MVWTWLVDLGFSDYSINEKGEVKSAVTGKVLKIHQDPSGRLSLLLYHDYKCRYVRIAHSKLLDYADGFDQDQLRRSYIAYNRRRTQM